VGALGELLERGLFSSTATTTAAAEKFKLDTDSVASFIDEECELDPDATTRRAALYAAYKHHCEKAAGRVPLQRRRFLDRIRDDHPELVETKRDGYDVFVGIQVGGGDAAAGGY
jgi:phage/plasmid-associated DNA primase